MVSCQYKVKATLGAVVAFWSCTFVACAAAPREDPETVSRGGVLGG